VGSGGAGPSWDEKKERELDPYAQLVIFLKEILGCRMRGWGREGMQLVGLVLGAARRISRKAEKKERVSGAAKRGRWRQRSEDSGGRRIAGRTVEGGEWRAAQRGALCDCGDGMR
jgi:hypothetical protein